MRILFITARPPWPGFRGDQARPAGWIRHLAGRHEIRVISQRWPGFVHGEPPVEVELIPVDVGKLGLGWAGARGVAGAVFGSSRPLQAALFDQGRFRAAVRHEVKAFRPQVAVVMLSRLGDVLAELDGIPTLLDFVDALSLNMAHRASCESRLAFLWRRESECFKSWDVRALARTQASLVVAERDRRAILNALPTDSVRRRAAKKLQVLPFGLDLPDQPSTPRRSDPPLIILTGNLGYFPTVDGAIWFANEIWPIVKSHLPEAVWHLAGARPPSKILDLAERPEIRVTPNPEDMSAVRQGAAIAIAPLRSGSGTPIKILEAMASGIPVVTTPEAAEGLDRLPQAAVAVARDAADLADQVVRLLRCPEEARQMADRAWGWLKRRHDLPRLAEQLEQQLLTLAKMD